MDPANWFSGQNPPFEDPSTQKHRPPLPKPAPPSQNYIPPYPPTSNMPIPPHPLPAPGSEHFNWNAPPAQGQVSYPPPYPPSPYPAINLQPYPEGWYGGSPQSFPPEYNAPPLLPRYALVSNMFSPIYLKPGQYTIGREQNNSIVLSDETVSKLHTLITVDPTGQTFIEDQNSKNKTLVNGIPIQGIVPLQLGSKITIGKFNIYYKDLNTAQLRKIPKTFLNHETAKLEYDGKNAMIGSLSSMSITELFTTLENNQKTGLLTVTDGANEGKVFFREGKVIRSEFRGTLNMNCIYKILKFKEGAFEFTSKDLKNIPDEIPLTTQQILFEFARNIDERR